MKETTLCYLIKDDKVLLALKKRGFFMGKINGPGGKIEQGETPEQACLREFLEETGTTLACVEARGTIEFQWQNQPEDWHQLCHIFVASGYTGEPHETEEMSPAWYPIDELPFERMWEDDPIWLPCVLAGGSVNMKLLFDRDGRMLSHE